MVKVGDVVLFIDEHKAKHLALVVAVHGQEYEIPPLSINLVYVSGDEREVDPMGRQMKRENSVVHIDNQSAKAFCWVSCGVTVHRTVV